MRSVKMSGARGMPVNSWKHRAMTLLLAMLAGGSRLAGLAAWPACQRGRCVAGPGAWCHDECRRTVGVDGVPGLHRHQPGRVCAERGPARASRDRPGWPPDRRARGGRGPGRRAVPGCGAGGVRPRHK